jgi:DNA-binding NarL/FixJ family response regulator
MEEQTRQAAAGARTLRAIPDASDTGQLTHRGLRLLVVDDHELILWGTRVLLCRLSWVQRCVQASTSEQALEYAGRYRPHVAIVDLMIGGQSGLELCTALRRTAPDTKVLLTSGIGEVSRARAVAAGAVGYLPKESDTDELLRAIRALHAGDTWFPAERPAQRPVGELSQREREVLQLMALGATNREIAQRMHLAPDTIKQYTSSVYRKLDAGNRAGAVHRGQQMGLIA